MVDGALSKPKRQKILPAADNYIERQADRALSKSKRQKKILPAAGTYIIVN